MQCFNLPVSILNEIEKLCRNFFWDQRKEERRTAWVAWDRLFLPKKEGGLGIRDLQAFNKALLAKQAWRILNNSQSLMVKTLKQKYFPNSDFMSAKVSSNSSYTWRSILSARELLSKGAKKIVGKGFSIDIWKDPWVPQLPNFRVLTRQNLSDDVPTRVSDLTLNDHWNEPLLNTLFRPWEVEAILKIPLVRYSTEDPWSWHFTKNGDFAVRSAYHIELKSRRADRASSSSLTGCSIWNNLWRANIPPKIKVFGWRALHNATPVRSNLKLRGIGTDDICSSCGEKSESQMHTFFLCNEASMVWACSPLRLDVNNCKNLSFMDWCCFLIHKYKDKSWWDLFWSLLWGIWLKRNAVIFDKRVIQIEETIKRALNIVGEYEKANEMLIFEITNSTMIKQCWFPPPAGVYKINADAVCFNDNYVGLGGVVRDSTRDIMMATCWKLKGGFEIENAEAIAARHALSTTLEIGLLHVVLETDNLKLFNHLKNRKHDSSSFGLIVKDILHLASYCLSCSFSHVGRKGNRVAHILANCSRNYNVMKVWLEGFPSCAADAVTHDISCFE